MTYQKNKPWTDTEALQNSLVAILTMNDKSFRDSAITTHLNSGAIVDTACPIDTNLWETGVKLSKESEWVVVEDYPNKEEAAQGHMKWCDTVRAGGPIPKDIHWNP